MCSTETLLFLNPNSNMCRLRQVGTEAFHELMSSMKSSIALCLFFFFNFLSLFLFLTKPRGCHSGALHFKHPSVQRP